jgi:predicted amidophosphoribosyltransferase
MRLDLGGLHVDAIAPYEGLWRRAIVAFKSGERAYAAAFAEVMQARAPARAVVVPVTTTRRRAAARGFDQAVELARLYAAGRTADVLRKRRGPAQHGLGRKGRLGLRGRFDVREPARVAGLSVLLVDDVCTTGATLRDAAWALRGAGAAVQGALVLATPQRFCHGVVS